MNWKVWVLSCFLSAVLPLAAEAQASRPKEGSQSNDKTQSVAVPAQVAALLRPILDEKQKSGQHDESRLSNLLYGLTQKKGRVADEALVVLMCFDVGESQEETDAVIGRGKRMLPLLKKYQDKNPKIAGRTYPDSMLKGSSSKADTFEGAVKAINHGWHSSADNPEG
ncbi:MAG TPA: hypothetical protein VK198_10620 [Terriglobales bacterium]|jgi:hypothetical protein|nr:hypothetical protein [Terriglobales bacterium]